MQNDPELNGKYLGSITKDFVKVCDTLKEAAYQLKVRKISDFPIFPISKGQLPIGQLLLGKEEVGTDFNYNFSFLDDFRLQSLVDEDKVEDFINAFKDPEEFCCLFVVEEEFQNFLFIPYPED